MREGLRAKKLINEKGRREGEREGKGGKCLRLGTERKLGNVSEGGRKRRRDGGSVREEEI